VTKQSANQLPDYPITQLPNSRSLLRVFVAFALLTAGATSTALAGEQKWELEFVGGGAFPSSGNAGDVDLPPPNSTLSGSFPSAARIVSSWYFGDGASQLNQAIASQLVLFRVSPSIVPLDAVLQSRFAKRRPGPTFGLRVSRVLTPRFSAEFTFESVSAELALESSSFTGLEASRLSFANAWSGFFPGPVSPTQTISVSSVATIDDNRGRQFATTGALLINLVQGRRLTPYAEVGAGVVASGDENPTAQLVGRYQYTLPPPPAPIPIPTLVIDETDTVSIRTAFDNRVAFVLGGGVKYSMNARFSLRLDVRDLIYGDTQRTELDATPATVPNPTSGLLSGTVPRITFGSSPLVRSTLSGGAISGFETFKATGTIHQIHATGGLIWRF
jgi:hypothetical protein